MTKSNEATTEEVAQWMTGQLDKLGELYQSEVVYEIEERFGSSFVYENENGNQAISRGVLQAFEKLTGNDVVWCRLDRYWRKREPGDEPGRQQP